MKERACAGEVEAKPVVILGTHSFARSLHVYLTADGGRQIAAFAAQPDRRGESEVLGAPVVPLDSLPDSHPPDQYEVCVGLGYWRVNRARAEMCEQLETLGYGLVSYTSSIATCWPGSFVSRRHTLLLSGTVVGPFARIGDDVTLGGCNVNHDAQVGDHCFVTTGATIGGEAVVGPYSFVGLNATIRNGVRIAPRCVIGAGALIKRDTEEGEVYSGRASEPLAVKSWELRDPF